METRVCGEPAIFQYAWGNKLKRACLVHANQAAAVAEVMGAPIQAQVVPTDELCQHQVEAAQRRQLSEDER